MPRTLPGADFFLPARTQEKRFTRGVLVPARGATRVLHLTHGECLDGAACDALVRIAHGTADVATAFLQPYDTARALELVARVPGRGRGLVVSDLSFQRGQGARVGKALDALKRLGWQVSWRDHHTKQWDDADVAAIAPHAHVDIERANKECGASMVQRDLLPDDAFAHEFARVVRDHDLWLREDARSIPLSSACHELGSEAFIVRILEGRDLEDAEIAAASARREERKRRETAWALAHSEIVEGERARVGVVYGNVPTNEVLHALGERGAHLSILLKPSGTVSLRSERGIDVCHIVAQAYGGGGHPNASGCKLPIKGALAYTGYWLRRTRDATARGIIDAAVRAVDAHLSK